MLLVDAGNSRIKWCLLHTDGTLSAVAAYAHNGADPAEWVDALWASLPRPDKIIIANVAGARVARALTAWCLAHWNLEPRFAVSRIHQLGVYNGYDNPDFLGVDRWVAMLGTRALYDAGFRQAPAHCDGHPRAGPARGARRAETDAGEPVATLPHLVVIDCGTAVTIDALCANGDHLGGVILPGVKLMHAALYRNTSLDEQPTPEAITLLGTNTRDCIWGGTMYGLAAAIDRIGGHMAEAMIGHARFGLGERAGDAPPPRPVQRVLTGGNAEGLLPHLQQSYRLTPDLIFLGLKQIAGYRVRG